MNRTDGAPAVASRHMYDAFGESVNGESTKFPATGISDARIVVMVQIDSGETVALLEPGCIPRYRHCDHSAHARGHKTLNSG